MHLLPDALKNWEHFHNDTPRNNHQVALTRTKSKNFGTKPRQIMFRSTCCHKFNTTTRSCEWHWPQAVFTTPTCELIESAHNNIFWKFQAR
jgi:hypothetical protein